MSSCGSILSDKYLKIKSSCAVHSGQGREIKKKIQVALSIFAEVIRVLNRLAGKQGEVSKVKGWKK